MTETITIGSSDVDAILAASTPEAKRVAADRLIEKVRKLAAADPGTIRIAKRAGEVGIPSALADVLATAAATGGTIQEAAWSLIERGGQAVRKSAAQPMTEPAALTAFMRDSGDGRRLAQAYNSPEGHLTAAEYVEVAKRRAARKALGSPDGTWAGVVDHLAQGFVALHGVSYREALELVKRDAPNVFDAYQNERGG